MSPDKTKPAPEPAPAQPAPKHPEGHKPAQPIDQAAHGRVRRPHGGDNKE